MVLTVLMLLHNAERRAHGEAHKILALAIHTGIQVYGNDPPIQPNAKMSLLSLSVKWGWSPQTLLSNLSPSFK